MLRTRLCALFGIDCPVVNAPMAGPAKAELAAAVAEAGGLGLIGGSSGDPDWLRQQIRAARALTNRPFGVGFISSFPGLDALVRTALDEHVAVITHSFADPTPCVESARAAGTLIIAQVQTVAQAVQAAEAGVDAITAQGVEAGGHTGTSSATLPLVPAVIDAVGDIPVLAAGGIADGRGLAAALVLGADGVLVGTRLWASREALVKPRHHEKILQAAGDDTVRTRVPDIARQLPWPRGFTARIARNAFTERWHGHEDELERSLAVEGPKYRQAFEAGDPEHTAVWFGEAAGLIHAIEPAATIVDRMVSEAAARLAQHGGATLA
jgi:nitronate monooxygenase